jgi:hypothetical protein
MTDLNFFQVRIPAAITPPTPILPNGSRWPHLFPSKGDTVLLWPI